jgi:uncharacterized membrane protein
MSDEREDRHRFARRLEAFSDIVFGFALAQCAFALEVPKTLAELPARANDLVFFSVTFALIGMFWFMHYRVFHYAFAGRMLDIFLNFVLLATVALLPYALRLYIKFPNSDIGAIAYASELGLGFSLLAALEFRGLRENAASLAPKPLRLIRNALRRHAVAGTLFLLSIPCMVLFGVFGRLVWGVIPLAVVAIRVAERRGARSAGTPAAATES